MQRAGGSLEDAGEAGGTEAAVDELADVEVGSGGVRVQPTARLSNVPPTIPAKTKNRFIVRATLAACDGKQSTPNVLTRARVQKNSRAQNENGTT